VKLNLYSLTAHSLLELLEKGEVSSEGILSSVLHRIDEVEANLNSFITIFREDSLS